MPKKIKLCIFDLEGTIFRKSYEIHGGREFPSAWGALCSSLGEGAEREDEINRQLFYSGGYHGYSHWVADTIRIYQRYGLRRDVFEKLINSVAYHSGVEETFAKLKEKGVATAIISGGFKALANRVALDHRVEHCFASAEFFWTDDGELRHWNLMPTDFAHKRTVTEMLLADLGLSKDECAFVGDGVNDVDVARYVGISVAFNPHVDLKNAAHYFVEQIRGQEDLTAILRFLF